MRKLLRYTKDGFLWLSILISLTLIFGSASIGALIIYHANKQPDSGVVCYADKDIIYKLRGE